MRCEGTWNSHRLFKPGCDGIPPLYQFIPVRRFIRFMADVRATTRENCHVQAMVRRRRIPELFRTTRTITKRQREKFSVIQPLSLLKKTLGSILTRGPGMSVSILLFRICGALPKMSEESCQRQPARGIISAVQWHGCTWSGGLPGSCAPVFGW